MDSKVDERSKITGAPKPQKKGRTMKEKLLLVLVVLLLMSPIIIVVVYLVVKEPSIMVMMSGSKEQDYCLTKGCVEAAALLDRYIDYKVNPCDNFYKFACGRWLKENVIPEDKSSLRSYGIIADQVAVTLKAILEEPIRPEEISSIKKIKTFYSSCMDTKTIDFNGDKPIKKLLISELGGWPLTHAMWNESQFDFLTTSTKLYKFGTDAIFILFVYFDNKNSSKYTLMLDQPFDLAMPGQKYYLVDRNDTMLMAYENYIMSVAKLLGLADPMTSKDDVRALVDFEIQLANISVPAEDRRDDNLLYNPMTLKEMQNNYSEILNWTKYVFGIMALPEVAVGITEKEIIINRSPPYFQRLIPVLQNTPKRTLANYLIWRFVMNMIWYGALGSKYDDLRKNYDQVVRGTSAQQARFKSCVRYASYFSYVVDRMFVKEMYDPVTNVKVQVMITEVKKAFNELLENVDWLDEKTKQITAEKNKFIGAKIGYSDEINNDTFIDQLFFNVTFNHNTFLENILSTESYLFYRRFQQLRKPVNKTAWDQPASRVNAFYSRSKNQITITAGFLQPPFYSKTFPMSFNFACIGSTIGHEITHGFDDNGRKYDKDGNLRQWWSPDIEEKFKAKAQCIINQYGNFTVEQIKMKVNGITTQGENIADNGGLKQAFRAYRNWVKSQGREEPDLPGLNFTHNQLFFIKLALEYCELTTDEEAIKGIRSHVHSPGEFRVIGPLQNSKDFAEAFKCPVGSNMNPQRKCNVW